MPAPDFAVKFCNVGFWLQNWFVTHARMDGFLLNKNDVLMSHHIGSCQSLNGSDSVMSWCVFSSMPCAASTCRPPRRTVLACILAPGATTTKLMARFWNREQIR